MRTAVEVQPGQLFLIFSDGTAFPPSMHYNVLFAWCLFIYGPRDPHVFVLNSRFEDKLPQNSLLLKMTQT